MRAPRVLLSPEGRPAVQLRDSSFGSRWIEVGFDYDAGGLQTRVHEDREVVGWPEYGAPA